MLPADTIAVRAAFAGRNRLDLNVSSVLGEASSSKEYLTALCAATDDQDVALKLWPGLPRDQGYWPNQANVDPFLAFVDALLDTAREACPRLDGIVIDMETPIGRTEELARMRAAGRTNLEIVMWLLAGVDEPAFMAARAKYADAVVRIRGRGYSVYVTTPGMNADDYHDGDETIAKALWTPIEGIEWDRVSFQVYRTIYDAHFPRADGLPYTSGLITSYAGTAIGKWGDRAGIDLGTTGIGIGIGVGLPDAAALQSDIAAALAAGVPPGRVGIFSVEGLDGRADADAWVAVPPARAAALDNDDEAVRSTFLLLDLLGT